MINALGLEFLNLLLTGVFLVTLLGAFRLILRSWRHAPEHRDTHEHRSRRSPTNARPPTSDFCQGTPDP